MDPETKLDAVRNVGIKDGRIAVITEDSITGADTIDASGLVVAPGFIDMHSHDEGHSHDHVFATWSWTSDRALSAPRLRSALERLPETVYRCKGVAQLEELPLYRYVLQMVGKRYHLDESGDWGSNTPRTEIVLIGGGDASDADTLQRTFDACVGTGDESPSPILRLVRKLKPELLNTSNNPQR